MIVDTKTRYIVSFIFAAYFLTVVAGFVRDLRFATGIVALVLFIADGPLIPADSYVACLPQIGFMLTWSVFAGINIIRWQNSKIFDDNIEEYGQPAVETVNVIEHFIPPLVHTWFVFQTRRIMIRYLDPPRILFSVVVVVGLAWIYCVYFDPVDRYHITSICLRTFVSLLFVVSSLAAILLVLIASSSVASAASLLSTRIAWIVPSRSSAAPTHKREEHLYPDANLLLFQQRPL